MHPGAWRWSFWERALWGDAAVASGLEAAAAFLQFGLTAVTLNGERGITRPVSKTYGSVSSGHAFSALEIYAEISPSRLFLSLALIAVKETISRIVQ
jgi:hypothetical protein